MNLHTIVCGENDNFPFQRIFTRPSAITCSGKTRKERIALSISEGSDIVCTPIGKW